MHLTAVGHLWTQKRGWEAMTCGHPFRAPTEGLCTSTASGTPRERGNETRRPASRAAPRGPGKPTSPPGGAC